jgi:hypothetical protein
MTAFCPTQISKPQRKSFQGRGKCRKERNAEKLEQEILGE